MESILEGNPTSMKINILQFRVLEKYVLRDTWWKKIIKLFRGHPEPDQYHFDVMMKIERPQLPLEANRIVELPNGVKLLVWHVEREIIKAKTYKFVNQNLQGYHPMEMYLHYDKRHGHMRW